MGFGPSIVLFLIVSVVGHERSRRGGVHLVADSRQTLWPSSRGRVGHNLRMRVLNPSRPLIATALGDNRGTDRRTDSRGEGAMLRKVFLIFLGAVAGAAVTLVTPQPRTVVEASCAYAAAEALQQLRLFSHVFERVRSDYVEKPNDAKLIEAAIKGMLAGLDPHSRYLDARGFRDAQVDTLVKCVVLALEIASDNGRIKVISDFDEIPEPQARSTARVPNTTLYAPHRNPPTPSSS